MTHTKLHIKLYMQSDPKSANWQLCPNSPVEIAFTRKKIYNKLKFCTMAQGHVLSHQKIIQL